MFLVLKRFLSKESHGIPEIIPRSLYRSMKGEGKKELFDNAHNDRLHCYQRSERQVRLEYLSKYKSLLPERDQLRNLRRGRQLRHAKQLEQWGTMDKAELQAMEREERESCQVEMEQTGSRYKKRTLTKPVDANNNTNPLENKKDKGSRKKVDPYRAEKPFKIGLDAIYNEKEALIVGDLNLADTRENLKRNRHQSYRGRQERSIGLKSGKSAPKSLDEMEAILTQTKMAIQIQAEKSRYLRWRRSVDSVRGSIFRRISKQKERETRIMYLSYMKQTSLGYLVTRENLDKVIAYAIENPVPLNSNVANILQTHRDWNLSLKPDHVFKDRWEKNYNSLEERAVLETKKQVQEMNECRLAESFLTLKQQ